MKKSIIVTLFFLVLTISCKVVKPKEDPIRDIPKVITNTYPTDLVPDEKTAVSIAKIILKSYFELKSFDNLQELSIKLTANGKVWDISTQTRITGYTGVTKSYHITINKNTAEILNIYDIK